MDNTRSDIFKRMSSDEEKVRVAARRMIEISEELQLTWALFERATIQAKNFAVIKKREY